jgi:hypothetical protein
MFKGRSRDRRKDIKKDRQACMGGKADGQTEGKI